MFTPEQRICVACGAQFYVGGRGRPKKSQRLCSFVCQQRSRYRRGAQSKQLTETQAAYIAGLVDGEGSIFIYLRPESVSMRVMLTNTQRDVLDWVHATTGVGRVYAGRAASSVDKACWNWWCNSDAADSLLRQIAQYMIVKTAQAALAMDFQARLRIPSFKIDREWQHEWRHTMRRLNKRGPVAISDVVAAGR